MLADDRNVFACFGKESGRDTADGTGSDENNSFGHDKSRSF
jgi:hypothetical protein